MEDNLFLQIIIQNIYENQNVSNYVFRKKT